MKYKRIFGLAFSSAILSFCVHLYSSYPEMQSAQKIPQFSIKPYPEEGFAAGTLVRTLDGFKPIEDIQEQDVVYGEFLEPKRVLKTAKRVVQKHVCLKTQHHTFYTGCDQVVRTAYDPMWQRIDILQKQAHLLDVLAGFRCIDQAESISKSIILYQLEVEDHTFCIGSVGIVVHNADIATVGTAMLFLEYVAYTNPVIAVIGSTLGLAEVAYRAYKEYQRQVQEKPKNTRDDESESEKKSPAELFLAERFYYEQRKKELTTLRDEFAGIYRSIVAIKELFHSQINTFSSQFLQHPVQQHTASNLLKISVTDELTLSDERKTALRKAREQEFVLLEKEISELHALLVVHFNELVRHVNEAHDAYNEALPPINQAINIWNAHLNATTDSIASSSYEQNIREECLLHAIQQTTAELKLAIAYYQRNKHYACLKQSTDIIERLDELHQAIIETEQWVPQELVRVSANQQGNEHYFARRAIATAGFKNQVKNTFNKDSTNKNNQALKKAKEVQTDICTTGGPNDPKKPKDDGSEDDEKVKTADMPENEGILGHIFRNEEGHPPRTPENYKLIKDLVKDSKNYLGPDMRGNRWWEKILENGKQLWAQAYKGVVRNGGINDVPRPYTAKTGLSKLI